MEDASGPEAARRFARSLNSLLKTVRLYGAEHERTMTLLGAAWQDLRAVLAAAGKTDKRFGPACSIATSGRGLGLQCFEPIKDYLGSRVHPLGAEA